MDMNFPADMFPRTAAPPFEAYAGEEPYLFVSYAHKDSSHVYPEILRLYEQGYRLWYDEGIEPGNEWPEDVARALKQCTLFLVFITPRSVASHNVRNEINFAINRRKPFLAVHLEETVLPDGLDLRMGDLQAILAHQMSPDRYQHHLLKALPPSLRPPLVQETLPLQPAAPVPSSPIEPQVHQEPSSPSVPLESGVLETKKKEMYRTLIVAALLTAFNVCTLGIPAPVLGPLALYCTLKARKICSAYPEIKGQDMTMAALTAVVISMVLAIGFYAIGAGVLGALSATAASGLGSLAVIKICGKQNANVL